MSAPVAFKCPNCASPLKAEDWDTATGIIKCSYCRALSTVPTAAASAGAPGNAFVARPPVPLPPGLQIEEGALGLNIKRRWFSWIVLFLIPFCIAWDSFLVFWFTGVLSKGGDVPWIVVVFPIAHVAAGVGMTYFTLATLMNSTRISLESGLMRVRHGPLPWRGNQDIDASSLDQLFCKEKVNRVKNGVHYTYEVWAVLRDGTSRKILGVSLDRDQALYIEQKLEQALGIKDRPVPGEVMR
ncbi:hypothetical protein DES53_11952 [Roseimicrobium gellanilyticum]|uniref:Uncharacterized protein n=1 Tax=Roseimicrobium gellanilyticum TaxID=748857 RepID=A0A366H281_9BACT|nr:hypothetical protein [Roseimicrobium gellanilyticum]RBP35886.1 hypothetical protein DES53_11952 [Roseimicrobium gellanilyticum]